MSEGILMRIFLNESSRAPSGRPLYEQIVLLAHNEGIAGATVFRGIMGFGTDKRVHSTKLVRLSDDLPVVVEIVDEREKIEGFLAVIDPLIREGLVTLEVANVMIYRGGDSASVKEDS